MWSLSPVMSECSFSGRGQGHQSKSSVERWYTQFDRHRFAYNTWDNRSRLASVMVECTLSITHCLRLNLQLPTIALIRTCRISSFCTVAWQLARFQLTRRIARSIGDSWASCYHATLCIRGTSRPFVRLSSVTNRFTTKTDKLRIT